jgi:hypothetical protein
MHKYDKFPTRKRSTTMTDERTQRNEGEWAKPSARSSGPGCCGSTMAPTMANCPCSSMMKGRKGGFLTILAVVFLAFLISQVGAVLGIIGFFRTF